MDDKSSLQVSFSLGRNKTVYVVGEYDHKQTSTDDRLRYLEIVGRFGQELGTELHQNYNARLRRIVLCEVDPGHIMFEVETDVSASIRRKAVENVQQRFEEREAEQQRVEKLRPTFSVSGPETPQ
jgi:hypothetical protein